MYRYFIKYSFIIWVFIYTDYFAKGQNTQLYFKSYSTIDGLSQNSVYCITQDKNDFIWLATGKGLNRFDGYEFVNYYHNPNDSNSISHSRVLDIEVDKWNRLWLATNAGVNCFDQSKEIFYHFKPDSNNSYSIWENMVKDLFIDSEGYLWVGTRSGLNVSLKPLDSISELSKNIRFRRIERNKLTNNLIIRISEDKKGDIWVATINGLNKINKKNFEIKQFYPDSTHKSKNANWISAIEINKNNTLWVSTLNGLYLLKNDSFISYNNHPFFVKNKSARAIYSLKTDKYNRLWIGTFNEGILMYNLKNNTFKTYKTNSDNFYKHANSNAYYLYIDRQSNLFVSTFSKGFSVSNILHVKFSSYIYNNRNIDSTDIIRSIIYDKKDFLWLGIHDKGLYHLNLKTGNVEKYQIPELTKDHVLPTVKCMLKNNDSTLWLGTLKKGLHLFNIKTKKIIKEIKYYEKNKLKSIETVFDIKKDKEGNLWIASWTGGLFKLEHSTKKLIRFTKENQRQKGFTSNHITSIYLADNGEIYLTTWGNGIFIFNPKTNSYRSYTNSNDSEINIPSNYCTVIQFDKNGVFWLGSTEGLFKLNEREKKVQSLHSRSVIDNEIIFSIEKDEQANLWIGTNYGLNRFSTQSFSVLSYKQTEGLPSNEYFIASSCKLPDGRLAFGSRNGLVVFHPDSILVPSVNIKVHITNFQISYNNIKARTIYNGEQILKKSILDTDTINLSYKNNILSFDFAACSYTKAASIQYAFILEGFNKDWTYVSSRKRFAVYTNLEPGEYILKIKATNIDGKWSPNIRKLVIVINVPFWKTKIFIFWVFIAIILIIVLLFRIKHQYIVKQKRLLEKQVRERTLELHKKTIKLIEQKEEIALQKEELLSVTEQLQELNKDLESKINLRTQRLNEALVKAEKSEKLISSFLANFSHEIRTPMNAISGFTQLMSIENLAQEKKQQYADIINANIDTLLHLIDNVMEIAKLHSGNYKFKNNFFDLHSLCLSVYQELKPIFKNEKVKIIFETNSIKQIKLYSDIRAFRQIIYNLLENAMKYTEKGSIKIKCHSNVSMEKYKNASFYVDNNNTIGFLIISVSDTGIGIKTENQKRIFDIFEKLGDTKNKVFRGTGLGLGLVKEFSEILNAEIDLHSTLNKGTTFTIKIPLGLIKSSF